MYICASLSKTIEATANLPNKSCQFITTSTIIFTNQDSW